MPGFDSLGLIDSLKHINAIGYDWRGPEPSRLAHPERAQ